MTAPGSAYPPSVEQLIPRARQLAEQLDRPLSRNILMKHFRIGSPKATAVLEALAAAEAHDTSEQDAPPPVRSVLALVPPPVSAPPADTPTADLPPVDGDVPAADPAPIVDDVPAAVPTVAAEPAASTAPAVTEPSARQPSPVTRYGMAALLTVVGFLLAGVIVAPIALSSQDIIDWAASPVGLGLTGSWPLVTFLALDAAAAVCVGLVVYCAWRGESAGAFAWLVWAFAGMSAYANYSHSASSAARDAAWFFPAMSIAGPFLLEIIVRRVRRWVQEGTGQRARHSVSFGLARWLPGVGALRETYGAWRLARLDGLTDARQAVTSYRQLCPDGSIRVLRALRNRDRNN